MRVYTYGIINDMPKGWAKGKGQPKWHEVVYTMWKAMWSRVYTHINYIGKTIQPKYLYLSGFIEDLQKLENFEDFKRNPIGWSLDKDLKGGTHIGYYFEYLSLISRSDNSKDRIKRLGYSHIHSKNSRKIASKNKMKPCLGLSKDKIVLYKSINDVRDRRFDPSSTSKACKGLRNHNYKGYKWFYINYKHNKTYHIKR